MLSQCSTRVPHLSHVSHECARTVLRATGVLPHTASEGPRKGRVITSSQVKFRENMFPLKEGYRPKDNLVELGLWHDLDWNMVSGDEVPEPHSDASDDESVSEVTDSASAVYQFKFNLCKLQYPTYLQSRLLLYRIGHSIGSAFVPRCTVTWSSEVEM